jgi:hypothetical protein
MNGRMGFHFLDQFREADVINLLIFMVFLCRFSLATPNTLQAPTSINMVTSITAA